MVILVKRSYLFDLVPVLPTPICLLQKIPLAVPSHSRHFRTYLLLCYNFVVAPLLFSFSFGGSMMVNKTNMCPLTIYIAYLYSTNL